MRFLKFLLFPLLLLGFIGFYFFPQLQNLWRSIHFFDADKIYYNFTEGHKFWASNTIKAAETPFIFEEKKDFELPKNFEFEAQKYLPKTYLDSSFTTSFLVIQDNKNVYEEYFLGHNKAKQHISWSVAKSYVSALVGIAISEGKIDNIDQKVEEFLPEMKGTGYEGVTLKELLQMASGVGFNEDYNDFWSDINRWGRYFAWGASQDEFAKSLKRTREPGTYNQYVSINTHVLGMVLVRATGKSLSAYLEEKIWREIGTENDAFWIIDNEGMEMALGGLFCTTRDYAKMGQLYLQNGNWEGKQLIDSAWVTASTIPDAPYLKLNNPDSANKYGFAYGYQWWLPVEDGSEFMACGHSNQYIYVNRKTNTIIVKTSANHRFRAGDNPYMRRDSVLELFRAVAEKAAANMPKIETVETVSE